MSDAILRSGIPRLGLTLALACLLPASASAQASFSDQTVSSGITFTPAIAADGNGGVMQIGGAVGDFDRNGWPDLFVLGGGGVADALFINNGDGSFTESAEAWRVDLAHRGHGATVGDYDGDGWPDIYVTSEGPMTAPPAPGEHMLYRNTGLGHFEEVASYAGVHQTSTTDLIAQGAAFGDYDLDGDLDLFVCTWGPANVGNRLFRNNGNGTFTDVTVAAGVYLVELWGFSPRFADMDGDRYPELLIAADFDSSKYFVNDGDGTFTDATASSGTGLDSNGMGQTIADLNNDLFLDWYVTSIYDDFPTDNNGNYLYIGRGGHNFDPVPESAGVTNGGWGWGTEAVDFDQDGWVDLAETNGWRLTEWLNEPSYLFRNNGDLTFTEVHASAGFVHTNQGRSLLTMDYDRDGDMDIIILSNDGALEVHRNDIAGPGTNWLEIFADTDAHPGLAPGGYGTRIRFTIGADTRMVYLSGGSTYLGTSQLVGHVGLGAATVIDQIVVDWADGSNTVLDNVPANQILTVSPASTPGEASGQLAMLAVLDDASGEIEVTYDPACASSDHTIYYGDLAAVSSGSYSGAVCGIGVSGVASFDPVGLADAFFVVVGTTGVVEGSYGAGLATERPEYQGPLACDLPQELSATCLP